MTFDFSEKIKKHLKGKHFGGKWAQNLRGMAVDVTLMALHKSHLEHLQAKYCHQMTAPNMHALSILSYISNELTHCKNIFFSEVKLG